MENKTGEPCEGQGWCGPRAGRQHLSSHTTEPPALVSFPIPQIREHLILWHLLVSPAADEDAFLLRIFCLDMT